MRAFAEPLAGASPEELTFRPIGDADLEFAFGLYALVRAAELAPVPWPEEEKHRFLHQQAALQHHHYVAHYPGADLLLIESNSVPIGRVYVYRTSDEIRLMDIALLPQRRNLGIGTALIHELLGEARATRRTLTLHVEPENPAQRLYARLGFRLIEHRGVYDFLGWSEDGSFS